MAYKKKTNIGENKRIYMKSADKQREAKRRAYKRRVVHINNIRQEKIRGKREDNIRSEKGTEYKRRQ